jgi:hypothetical protein
MPATKLLGKAESLTVSDIDIKPIQVYMSLVNIKIKGTYQPEFKGIGMDGLMSV